MRASYRKLYETGGKFRWAAVIKNEAGKSVWQCDHTHYLREGVGQRFTHTYRNRPLPRSSWSAAACAHKELEEMAVAL